MQLQLPNPPQAPVKPSHPPTTHTNTDAHKWTEARSALSDARLHKHALRYVVFAQICPIKQQSLQTLSTPCHVWRTRLGLSPHKCVYDVFPSEVFQGSDAGCLPTCRVLQILSASHCCQPYPLFEARLSPIMAVGAVRSSCFYSNFVFIF